MKRIKMVLWERRIASLQAKEILRVELEREKREPASADIDAIATPDAIGVDLRVESVSIVESNLNGLTGEEEENERIALLGRKPKSTAYKSKVTRKKSPRRTTSFALE
jgi:hypothetical protein